MGTSSPFFPAYKRGHPNVCTSIRLLSIEKCNKKATLALTDMGCMCTHQASKQANKISNQSSWNVFYFAHASVLRASSIPSYRSLLLKYCLGFSHSSTIEINCSASSVFAVWYWHQTNTQDFWLSELLLLFNRMSNHWQLLLK